MGRWQALTGGPLMIVISELLLLVCSLCYLAWWTITFRPSAQTSSGGGLFLAGAVLGGFGGLILLAVGIATLLPKASSRALVATIVSGAVVGALLLLLTSILAHRPITTELPLIIIWATAQLSTGITLRTAGALGPAAVSSWIAAVTIATVIALVCYLIFYRLDPIPAYWVGMVPLAVDGVTAATLAAIVILTRAPRETAG